jgi:Uri superfamily endonuclease
MNDRVSREPGAYVLLIELDAPLALEVATLPRAVLPPGRYAYCGSAKGPGGLGARIARHRRKGKPEHWHVDRLTAAGRIAAVHAEPGGSECDLVSRLCALPGTSVPVPGFGSTDCAACPAHLLAVPVDFDPATLQGR